MEESSRYNWYGIEDMIMSEDQEKIIKLKDIEKVQAINVVKEEAKCQEIKLQLGGLTKTAVMALSMFGILKNVDPDALDKVVNSTGALVCAGVAIFTGLEDLFKTFKVLKNNKKKDEK